MYRLHYELKLIGLRAVFTPIIVMTACGLLSILMNHAAERILSAGMEMLLPLSSGLTGAWIVSSDHALELQLTMPNSYRRTVLYRLIIIALPVCCVAVISSTIVFVSGLSFMPYPSSPFPMWLEYLTSQLIWLPSLLWYLAVGVGTALVFRSHAVNTALLTGNWLIQILFKDVFVLTPALFPIFLFPTTLFPQADFHNWLLNRFLVLVTATICFVVDWMLMLRPVRLLKEVGEG